MRMLKDLGWALAALAALFILSRIISYCRAVLKELEGWDEQEWRYHHRRSTRRPRYYYNNYNYHYRYKTPTTHHYGYDTNRLSETEWQLFNHSNKENGSEILRARAPYPMPLPSHLANQSDVAGPAELTTGPREGAYKDADLPQKSDDTGAESMETTKEPEDTSSSPYLFQPIRFQDKRSVYPGVPGLLGTAQDVQRR